MTVFVVLVVAKFHGKGIQNLHGVALEQLILFQHRAKSKEEKKQQQKPYFRSCQEEVFF